MQDITIVPKPMSLPPMEMLSASIDYPGMPTMASRPAAPSSVVGPLDAVAPDHVVEPATEPEHASDANATGRNELSRPAASCGAASAERWHPALSHRSPFAPSPDAYESPTANTVRGVAAA